ncbi:MAG: hypothetical protein COT89_00135 [Candidatus Colwellbacteria bacterium CG10_big_fil_rev_8_21_14_0_10_42_22]|uniref:Methenyltetrahydrofolate cyclohydrolase n=1 Tax=Candidatus Colwellbacteria bacterium CG10_big_fil_rev_8_21_14_0_10_42_22 TaxID=1974540 RepID=A0A2H0VGQ4_9BACT|nr:MAG: hypothetical protein COT89_00135 [Candidatus Colwellbacteria bacterium CG10_big_fil_rev_8_21_14_0_10_42_22]
MQKISGKEVSGEIIEKLKTKKTPDKILGAILIGEDPTSISFLKQKEKIAKDLGIDFRLYNFSESIKNDDLRKEINKLARSKRIGGLILQLPLPKGVNKNYVLNAIPREKDVDVLSERALGAFYKGRNLVSPPSVGVVEEIIERLDLKLEKLTVVVVGLGDLVGKPISVWLTDKCRNLHLLRSGSDLEIIKGADLIISGVGKAGVVKEINLRDGSGVIDFGYYYTPNGQLLGDFEKDKKSDKVLFYTPTPGGTGPILVAKLMENFYKLNA